MIYYINVVNILIYNCTKWEKVVLQVLHYVASYRKFKIFWLNVYKGCPHEDPIYSF